MDALIVLGLIIAFFFFMRRAEQARTTAGKVAAGIPLVVIAIIWIALRMQ